MDKNLMVVVHQAQRKSREGEQEGSRRPIGEGERAMGRTLTPQTPVLIRMRRRMTSTVKVRKRGRISTVERRKGKIKRYEPSDDNESDTDSDLEVIRPLDDFFTKAVDYMTYRLRNKDSEYNSRVAQKIIK